jgi:hypothetical protein
MESEQSSAAPAQSTESSPVPAATPTTTAPAAVSAADQAVAAKDVTAFREARRAERGDPATRPTAPPGAAVEAKPAPAKGPAQTPPDPGSNRQQRLQQQINGYERELAELRADNARLRGQTPPDARPTGAPPSPAAAPSSAPLIDIRQPPLEEAAFYTKFPQASTADYVRYLTRFDREVDRVTQHMQASQKAESEAAHARAVKFHDQVKAAGDPAAILDRLDPELVALETRAYARAQGKALTAANDLAEEILDSDVALPVLEHLTAHPEVKKKLLESADRRALVRRFRDLERQVTPAASAGTAPKTVTQAPPPAVTLGARAAQLGDPADAAVARGDVAGYREARRAQRAAQQLR